MHSQIKRASSHSSGTGATLRVSALRTAEYTCSASPRSSASTREPSAVSGDATALRLKHVFANTPSAPAILVMQGEGERVQGSGLFG